MATASSTQGDDVKVIKTETFLWVLRDIVDSHVSDDINLATAELNLKGVSGKNWNVSLCNHKSSLDLKLTLTNYADFLQTSFSACVLDAKMNRKYERNATELLHGTCYNYLSFKKFLPLRKNLKNFKTLLHKEDLFLLGTITIFQNETENIISVPEYENYYGRNMRCLLKHGMYADFTIKVQDKEFRCHKCILGFRSLYFESLFRCDMKEKRSNVLVLQDIEPYVFQQVLVYIYSNEVEISERNVVQLLSAAEKYLLSGLKQKCEEMLFDYFSYSNLPTIAVIADKFQLHDLKLRVIHMYAMFMKQIQSHLKDTHQKGNKSLPRVLKEDPFQENISAFNSENIESPLKSALESAFFPPATVWVTTYRNLILDCKMRLRTNASSTKNSKLLIKNKNFKVLFQVHHFFKCVSHDQHNILYRFKLYFQLVSAEKKNISMRFQISCIDTSQSEVNKETFSTKIELGKDVCIFTGIIGESCLHDDETMIVRCKGWLEECSIYYLTERNQGQNTVMNLTALYANATFTDMVIKVKDTAFQCHRAIVTCQSRLLAEMIEKSTVDGVLKLMNTDPETIRNILKYLYISDCKLNQAEAMELLPLSCQFKLEHLKSMCERTLALSLNAENAVDILNLSVLYSTTTLMDCASRFVRLFLHDIMAISESDSCKNIV